MSSPDHRRLRPISTADNPEIRRLQPLQSDHSPKFSPAVGELWDADGRLVACSDDFEDDALPPDSIQFVHMLPKSREYIARREKTKKSAPESASEPRNEPKPENADPQRRVRDSRAFYERQAKSASKKVVAEEKSKRSTCALNEKSFAKFLERQTLSAQNHITAVAIEEEKPERVPMSDTMSAAISSKPSISSQERNDMRFAALKVLCEQAEAEVKEEYTGQPEFVSSPLQRERAARRRDSILQLKQDRAKELQTANAESQDEGMGKPEIHAVPSYLHMTNQALGRKPWKALAPDFK
jgi:hypothetical protein